MRKRRLFLAVGACMAAVALTAGTALADPNPPPNPPNVPYPPIEIGGAQTTEGLMSDLCNNIIPGVPPGNFPPCGSWDVEGPTSITTRDPAAHPECQNIERPQQGGDGFDRLIQRPTCWDAARVVTSADKATRPTGFTYIPVATDALTYAVRSDGTVPLSLDIPTLKRIYQCDPALTFPSNPNGFKPLIGGFGAGNRTLFFKTLGITDSATYTTSFPCVRDKDSHGVGLLANDGTVLTDPANLITYSSAPYFAQVNRVEQDIHGFAILGSINGIPPETLNPNSAISRPVYNVVRTPNVTSPTGPGTVHDLFVGPTSQVCSNPTVIQQHGFSLASNCGDTSLVTTN
ncbi:MAG: hypothetical protein ACRDQU_13695 [Pseudonocardiaceae bacterium]